jgi:hypothetical protein
LLQINVIGTAVGNELPAIGHQRRTDFHSAQQDFDLVRVVIKHRNFRRVSTLTNIPWKTTANGREIELDTKANDYALRPMDRRSDTSNFKDDPFKNSSDVQRDPFAGKAR